MNGKITVESEPSNGSTFHFTAKMGLGKPETRTHLKAKLIKRTVLVVEGNASTRRYLTKLFDYWNMEPIVLSSGAEAIELLDRREKFDFIILDGSVKDADGFAVAEHVKNVYGSKPPTVIMMLSSAIKRGVIERHADLPVSAYLNKPVGEIELLEILTRSLQSLPAQNHVREDEHTNGEQERKTSPHRTIRILLAEDNVVNQRLALRILEKFGYNVTVAENGVKAVQHFTHETFYLILMDVQMPEMGGFEATACIREIEENHKNKRTPIVAMTAHAIQGYREKCLEGGMDGYISKPIQIATLRKVLEEFLHSDNHKELEEIPAVSN